MYIQTIILLLFVLNNVNASFINDCYKVETGVSIIDYFVLFVIDEIAHFGFTSND